MKPRFKFLFCLVILSVISANLALPANASATEPIVVGIPHSEKYTYADMMKNSFEMALEKINKAILVLLGAGIALILATWKNIITGGETHDGHSLPTYIQMVDWGTIGIIIGSTIFVELICRSGLFA